MRLLDLERHFILTWTLAILGGVGVLGLCAMLALVLGTMRTGWFNVVWLGVCGLVAVAPAVTRIVRKSARKRFRPLIVA